MGNVSLPLPDVQNGVLTSTNVVLPPTPSHMVWYRADSSITVSIVSNSHLLREALILLIHNHWSINTSPSQFSKIESIASSNPSQSLILLDSNIGHSAVLANIKDWRSRSPIPYIVVLELRDDPEMILDCIETGAHGYALQGASSTEVVHIIDQVFQGVAQCSPEITAKLFDRLNQTKTMPPKKLKPALTRREIEVLGLIAQEYSDRNIAAELVIEVRTVKHHVHNILRKLSVKHRWDAAQLAITNGWLNLTSS